MIHTACDLRAEHVNNFVLMLLVTSSEYGEANQYRSAREFHAVDTSDIEKTQLLLEHERTDFLYTSAIEIIETATGCDDFKFDEMDADDCEEGRDYHTELECQIVDTELLLIYSNRADQIVIKTIGGGDHLRAFTHDGEETNTVSPFRR